MSSDLVEKRGKLDAKRKELATIFEEAGPDVDLSKVKSVAGDNSHKRMEIKRLNDEMTALGAEVDELVAIEVIKTNTAEVGRKLNDPNSGGLILPGKGGKMEAELKSPGEQFTSAPFYKGRHTPVMQPVIMDMDPRKYLAGAFESKAVMSETYPGGGTGWTPQAIRTGKVVPFALRPIQMLDLIPQGETTQAAIVYMEETTSTNGAVETGEGATYPQATLIFTEKNVPVRKIPILLPVTDEQLDDVPQVQGYVDGRLRFFVMQRLDGQVLVGDGTGSNIKGFLNVAGIQTQAKGSDPGPDALFKAIVKVNYTGFAQAGAVALNPIDWQNIRLLRTAEGVYIWGSPSEAGPERIWGLPVAQANALTLGTSLVGDFANFSELDFRKQLEVSIGYVNDDFAKGQKSLRAEVRVVLVVYRPAAFCTVTGL